MIVFEKARYARLIGRGCAHDLVSFGALEIRLDHLVVLAVREHERTQLAASQSFKTITIIVSSEFDI